MSLKLIICLIIYTIFWLCLVIYYVRHKKIAVRYSLFWIIPTFCLFLASVFPGIISSINKLFGFEVLSNLILGIFITILMLITFVLTVVVTKQKETIKDLVQEVSMLESEIRK